MVQRLPDPPLVPSSMSAGNTVATDPHLAMTAPGSPSILPVPDALDRLPLPVASGEEIPVSNHRDRYHTDGTPGASPWRTTGTEGQSYEGTSYGDAQGQLH